MTKSPFLTSIISVLSCCALPMMASRAQTATAQTPVLLRSAVVTLKAPDFIAASRQIQSAAEKQSAMLDDAQTTIDGSGRRSGWVRLRVPAEHLPGMLAEIRQVGTLYAEKLKTADDASRYDSLALRADRLQQHETRLGSVLTNERRLRGSDILFVQDKLFRASVDESLLRQERVDLARKTRTSRLLIFLFEPAPTGARAASRRSVSAQFIFARQRAVNALTESVRRSVTALAWTTVYGPIWIAIAVVPFLLFLRLRKSFWRTLRVLAGWIHAIYFSRGEVSTRSAALPPPMSGDQP